MFGSVDKEVLIGFVEEANGYLPAIRQGIEAYLADSTRLEGLEAAHRHAHTIKGAASMIGLNSLSHIAYYLEEVVEDIGAGQRSLDKTMAAWLTQIIDCIEAYLHDLLNDSLDEASLLTKVTQAYRHLRGIPVEEDSLTSAEASLEVGHALPAAPSIPGQTTILPERAPVEAAIDFVDDDIATELMEAFTLEAEDHLRIISQSLASLDKNYDDKESLQKVRRCVHTLKGSAGTIGLQTLSEVSHRMEDLLDELYEGDLTLNSELMDLLFISADTLEDLAKEEVGEAALQDTIQHLYMRYEEILGKIPNLEAPTPSATMPVKRQVIDLSEVGVQTPTAGRGRPTDGAAPARPAQSAQDEAARRISGDMVRVPIERLDELIRLVGELVITRTSFEQRMGDLVREVEELRPSIERLRRISTKLETDYEVSTLGNGFRRLALSSGEPAGAVTISPTAHNPVYLATQPHEFDELEFDRYTEFHLLSRELTETTSDVNSIGNSMNILIGDFDSVLNRQSRLSSELQEKLMRARMIPLGTLSSRLHRTVRVVARKQNKAVDLVIEGEHIELDKTVLEEMSDPLLHLLRNAVDHGIESPQVRKALGKPERGLIHVQAYHEGNQVIIKISDDGAGVDPATIRARAVSGGYVSEADIHQLSEEELYALILLPGFSTAGEVSEVSGRGVGMDVVKTNVNKLKGTVTLGSTSGQGMTFTIRLPMTLAVTRALFVNAHHETFALPFNSVSQILHLEREAFERIGQEPIVRLGGKVYPLLRLGEVLQLKQPADDTVTRQPVLIVNVGGKEVALIVDQVLQGREIVIKNLGSHLRYVRGVMGATLMGDGSVVLILNPADWLDRSTQVEVHSSRPQATSTPAMWNIMVVDDSVSVRRIVSNLIKSAGWQPTTAKDGLEALEVIQHSTRLPDLILLDVEMPRMDGYELMTTLRGQEEYKEIPIVMLTSRAGEKHRRKAFELGVSEYLVKPYQDEILLGTVRQLVQAARRSAVA